ncbi:hypothetical protein PCANC_03354 [Puccinia coronata f. sp. avenae]|uniref:ATPase AAA-type core domain-containing protein n=1 Tax=Puccinia coronata f. sp. avenae TaxID=200324 RepID=A0A2N5T8P7_9BASI|nr:hypothetical protein PCANC_03354 [Puccinia coronata f. sp. avenae]
MRKDVTLYPVHPPDLRDPNIGRNSFNQHHDKSTFTCIQVTSQSTKAPLYFVISLVYKRKGFVAVQVIAGASTDCSFSHCHARNICGQQLQRKAGDALKEFRIDLTAKAKKGQFDPCIAEKVRRKPFSLVLLDEFERARAGVIDRKTGQVTEANKEAVRQAVKVLFPPGLINWLDDLVVFHSLAEESVLQIVNVRP